MSKATREQVNRLLMFLDRDLELCRQVWGLGELGEVEIKTILNSLSENEAGEFISKFSSRLTAALEEQQ